MIPLKSIKINVKLPHRYEITRNGIHYLVKTRRKLGLLQRLVAKRIGISQTAISKLELGKRNLKMKNLEKILKMYRINKSEFFKKFVLTRTVIEFPSTINQDLAQLLGYLLGDGNRDKNRITISERELPILDVYGNIVKKLFSLDPHIKLRDGKGYHEMRIYNKYLLSVIESEFPGILTPHRKDIPENICKLKKRELAAFLKGLYDAEGWIDKKAKILGITMNNRPIIRKLKLMLLRWGIISSIREVKMDGSFTKKIRYNLRVTDLESIKMFSKHVSFSSKRKKAELDNILLKSSTFYVDQIPIRGRYLFKLIHELGLTTGDFPKVQHFFYDNKGISYKIFRKNILEIIGKKGSGNKRNVIVNYLKAIMNSDIISVRIKSVDALKTDENFFDMYVPKYNSFIANGFILHNSQARYARVREGLLNDHMKKTGEIATSYFREMPDLKGIIIGGPGPIKDMFFNGEFLPTDVKSKVLGVVDTSYTGKFGLEEMLERGEDILAEASVTRERRILERFFSELSKDSGLAVYGLKETVKALEAGAIEMLLISEGFEWVDAKLSCPGCKKEIEKMVKESKLDSVECPECGKAMEAIEKGDAAEKLAEAAEKVNTVVEIISTDTREGEQLFEMGGIAGILRYKV